MKAVCIGGSLDGKIVPILSPPNTDDYRLEHIGKDGEPVLSFYVHNDMTTSAAFHTVFAAYAKGNK